MQKYRLESSAAPFK